MVNDSCNDVTAWPAIIFIVIVIILLAGIALSPTVNSDVRAWTFAIILVASIIWSMIIYWFCYLGYQTIGWFMLTLPIFIYLAWLVSYWMATVTTYNQCVMGGIDEVWPKMLTSVGLIKSTPIINE